MRFISVIGVHANRHPLKDNYPKSLAEALLDTIDDTGRSIHSNQYYDAENTSDRLSQCDESSAVLDKPSIGTSVLSVYDRG